MIITNHNRATNIKFGYYLFTFLYLLSVILTLYWETSNTLLYLGLFTTVFLCILIISFLLRLNHIIFIDNSDKLVLRYYPLHPFHDKFKSIEIPKDKFSHINIKRGLFSLRTEIILFQQTAHGIAKYPPVSITAFSPKDRNNILMLLKKYSRKRSI